jgi:hypothetical protein
MNHLKPKSMSSIKRRILKLSVLVIVTIAGLLYFLAVLRMTDRSDNVFPELQGTSTLVDIPEVPLTREGVRAVKIVKFDEPIKIQFPHTTDLPEVLHGFMRIKNAVDVPYEEMLRWVEDSARDVVTPDAFEKMKRQQRQVNGGQVSYVSHLAFVNDGQRSYMFVLFYYGKSRPKEPLAFSPYVLESGRWKTATNDLDRILKMASALKLSRPSVALAELTHESE